jgi:hypothetical protein
MRYLSKVFFTVYVFLGPRSNKIFYDCNFSANRLPIYDHSALTQRTQETSLILMHCGETLHNSVYEESLQLYWVNTE